MIKIVTAIYDKCTGYMDPVVALSAVEAVRGFKFALSDKNSPIGFSPADFDLYELGNYDTHTGELIPLCKPRFLCNGALLLNGDSGDIGEFHDC